MSEGERILRKERRDYTDDQGRYTNEHVLELSSKLDLKINHRADSCDLVLIRKADGKEVSLNTEFPRYKFIPVQSFFHVVHAAHLRKKHVYVDIDDLRSNPINILAVLHEVGHHRIFEGQGAMRNVCVKIQGYAVGKARESDSAVVSNKIILHEEKWAWLEAFRIVKELRHKGFDILEGLPQKEVGALTKWVRATGLGTYEGALEQAIVKKDEKWQEFWTKVKGVLKK